MTNPGNPSGRSGATRDTGAVRNEPRRRLPPWLLLLGLLVVLLIIAGILIAVLSGGSDKKAAAVAPLPVGAPSVAPSSFIPTLASSAAPTTEPSASAAVPAQATPALTPTAVTSTGTAVPGTPTAGTRAAAAPATPTPSTSAGPPLIGGGTVVPSAATGTLAAGDTLGTILFAENSSELTANAKKVISDAASRIKANRPPKIVLTGYTDIIAGQPSNLTLSKARAENVEKQLHDDVGPGPTAYSTHAIGEKDPVATNSTAAGRQLNRRATVTTD